jgi:hypothetical protein
MKAMYVLHASESLFFFFFFGESPFVCAASLSFSALRAFFLAFRSSSVSSYKKW